MKNRRATPKIILALISIIVFSAFTSMFFHQCNSKKENRKQGAKVNLETVTKSVSDSLSDSLKAALIEKRRIDSINVIRRVDSLRIVTPPPYVPFYGR